MAKEIHKLFIVIIISTNPNSLWNDFFHDDCGHSEQARKWIKLIELSVMEKMKERIRQKSIELSRVKLISKLKISDGKQRRIIWIWFV